MRILNRFATWYKALPTTKQHIDVLVALLTVALSSTLLVQNLRNLQIKPNQDKPTTPQVIITPVNTSPTTAPSETPEVCQKGIGDISIASPNEGDTVNDNPLCINISYNQGNYCSSVWQYKINSGSWSEWGNTSPCLYNVPAGKINFTMQVKSLVSSDIKTLTRSFYYQPPTQPASSSAH